MNYFSEDEKVTEENNSIYNYFLDNNIVQKDKFEDALTPERILKPGF